MKLARVAGTVVSTINVPVFDGRKLLLCDLVAPDGSAGGGYLIAVDTVGAGVGETVLLLDEGNGARQILGARDAPVRTLVVGIVDHVEVEEPAGPAPAGPQRAPARGAAKGAPAKGASADRGAPAAASGSRRRASRGPG